MANETELNDFTKDELVALAEQFGVEVKHSWHKAAIVKAFEDDGVTVELIHGFQPDTEEELKSKGLHPLTPAEVEQATPAEAPVQEDEPELVLVKMTRANYSYEIRGYRFTREHPFALVKEDDADYLVEEDGGFAIATPKEARAYYS